jgi:hypothetical protein
LIEVWSSKGVDEAYQNTFLANLDEIDEDEGKKVIQE